MAFPQLARQRRTYGNKRGAPWMLFPRGANSRRCVAPATPGRNQTVFWTQEYGSRSERGTRVEVEALWDDRPDGNVRVMGSIDDGGWRAFVPLTESFVMACDGSLVGE